MHYLISTSALLVLFFCSCSQADDKTYNTSKMDAGTVMPVDENRLSPDTNQIVYPAITVLAYERTDIFFDTEGWPVEPGKVSIIKDFQKNKVYRLKKDQDYLQKIEIIGASDHITIQVFDGARNRVYEEKNITLDGKKVYTASDPAGNHDAHYQEWMHGTVSMKVLYKEAVIFEGTVIQKK